MIEKLLAKPPPDGPRARDPRGRRGLRRRLQRATSPRSGVADIPDPPARASRGSGRSAEIDAYRRFYQLALLASRGVAIDGIGGAQPPTPVLRPPLDPDTIAGLARGGQASASPLGGLGSNAYGLGEEATADGSGMVLGNPHFPWQGAERFYQSHLTIPGKLNVSGASLFGVPLILIGHTDNMAWSHTVSTAFRFTPFAELTRSYPARTHDAQRSASIPRPAFST